MGSLQRDRGPNAGMIDHDHLQVADPTHTDMRAEPLQDRKGEHVLVHHDCLSNSPEPQTYARNALTSDAANAADHIGSARSRRDAWRYSPGDSVHPLPDEMSAR
jgi:hypothetical protein